MNEIIRTVGPHERTLATLRARPQKHSTTAELVRLTELGVFTAEDRFELIDGEIVPMSPISRRHEVVAGTIERFMHDRERDREAPQFHVVNERQFNLADDAYCKPDIFLKPSSLLANDVRGTTALLIVEVAKTSFEFETGRKADTYARHGVRDYWVVSADSLVTRVHRQPGLEGCADVQDVAPEATIVPLLVPELALRLADLGLT